MTLKFHPKAINWSLKTYDYLREVRDSELRELEPLFKSAMGFYREIYNSDPRGSKAQLDKLKNMANISRDNFAEELDTLIQKLSGDLASSPLKSINSIFIKTLKSGQYDEEKLLEAFKKMVFSRNLKRSLRVKLVIDPEVTKEFNVEKVLLSLEDVQEVERRYKQWLTQLYHEGLDRIQKDSYWQDHEIGVYSDRWTGRRSVKLDRKKARLIYRVEEEIKEDFIVATVIVERITGLHNYTP